ncbi:MAG TPA: methyl-accepting chemotaxis protein, partial [Spirochaetia bacterium]|nr:methyl-accepting chemotaxis protein [Spirochaetia bacterium]
ERSQAIGEIISVVGDLAEQSNVLAVNASIEAAKAGDQGKGFAVVAREIKSLADQSRRATSQVRTILGDIQKATSMAVMAAEQGSKAVDAGVTQSAEVTVAIRVLGESIDEASQASAQISVSSQEQLVGMDQIAIAMESIRDASTQNIASTKQAENAAQQLHDLGRRLKGLIAQFQV